MMACATPLASTIATGSRINSASARATSGQSTAIRRVHFFRESSSAGILPARMSPSVTILELPSAAAKSVE